MDSNPTYYNPLLQGDSGALKRALNKAMGFTDDTLGGTACCGGQFLYKRKPRTCESEPAPGPGAAEPCYGLPGTGQTPWRIYRSG